MAKASINVISVFEIISISSLIGSIFVDFGMVFTTSLTVFT